jgi:hypothetical protein
MGIGWELDGNAFFITIFSHKPTAQKCRPAGAFNGTQIFFYKNVVPPGLKDLCNGTYIFFLQKNRPYGTKRFV